MTAGAAYPPPAGMPAQSYPAPADPQAAAYGDVQQPQYPPPKQQGDAAYSQPQAPRTNAKGKPVDAQGHVIKRILPTDQPVVFYYKRKGYNDYLYLEGGPVGPVAYYVDVKALLAGWSIFLRRGNTRAAPAVLHLTKGVCLIWDKGTQVNIEAVESQPWHPVTQMLRKYEFINKYTFPYNGRLYTWEWMECLGGTHFCKDAETHEVICIARLHITIAPQIISAWGLRLRGTIEMYGVGKSMVELLLATMSAQIEWRKHNNKLLNIWSTIPFL